MKFSTMAFPAMALLQQHDARRDILIKPAARRRAAIEARGHSELGALELGAQSGRKNPPACLSVCVCVSDRHFYPSTLTDFDETWSKGPYSDVVWPRP